MILANEHRDHSESMCQDLVWLTARTDGFKRTADEPEPNPTNPNRQKLNDREDDENDRRLAPHASKNALRSQMESDGGVCCERLLPDTVKFQNAETRRMETSATVMRFTEIKALMICKVGLNRRKLLNSLQFFPGHTYFAALSVDACSSSTEKV